MICFPFNFLRSMQQYWFNNSKINQKLHWKRIWLFKNVQINFERVFYLYLRKIQKHLINFMVALVSVAPNTRYPTELMTTQQLNKFI